MLYLINYPDVQKKARDEVDMVVGRNNLPSLADRDNLHYVQAVTFEVMRHANLAPLAGFPSR